MERVVSMTQEHFFRSVPLCCTPGHARAGSSFTRCRNTPQATYCEGVAQHNPTCHNATPRSEPASFQFRSPPSPSGRLRGMSNRTIHAMTQYRFAEDPRFLHEIVAIVNRLAQEHQEVENIFSGTLTNDVLICIRCCRSFVADPTPANKKRMRAVWLKLSFSERFAIQRIVVLQADELRVREICWLAGKSSPRIRSGSKPKPRSDPEVASTGVSAMSEVTATTSTAIPQTPTTSISGDGFRSASVAVRRMSL